MERTRGEARVRTWSLFPVPCTGPGAPGWPGAGCSPRARCQWVCGRGMLHERRPHNLEVGKPALQSGPHHQTACASSVGHVTFPGLGFSTSLVFKALVSWCAEAARAPDSD